MRIALVLVIALAAAGCAKKAKPAAAPTPVETKESAPSGGAPDADDAADEGKGGTQTKGDPCDGGESKGK